jgi:hypothetical protein
LKSSVFLFLFFLVQQLSGQVIPAGFPVLEEKQRRNQLINSDSVNGSFLLKPFIQGDSIYAITQAIPSPLEGLQIGVLPFLNTTRFLSNRPYGWGDYGFIPNPGFQTYLSGGIQAKYKFFNFTFRPELVLAQNSGFDTDIEKFSTLEIQRRFLLWNISDFPETFGNSWIFRPWWGQSKLTFQYGSFEIGGSTQNIWWGPGQFNALTFSNNSQGFPYLTLNTTKPAKTAIGKFELQLIVGRLENSGVAPSQNEELNEKYFKPFTGDWRYLNALTVSYSPKWVSGLHLGFTRTFQQYSDSLGTGFLAYFPVFEPLTKENIDINQVGGTDQQLTVFGRWAFTKTKSEMYFEFGRRDHSANWRDFILSPEHARAYILGFIQLFDLPGSTKLVQVRGEVTHQQESVNRYIRYPGLGGGLTWHTHVQNRGFVNYGQPLGVGIGTGSNVQTLEVGVVEGIEKVGFVFERLANNQDFYYKALFQFTERKPWIDLSLGFLYDKQINNLLFSSKLQVIHAKNYQWQLDPTSTPEFPKGENLTSVMAQVSLIYFWKKKEVENSAK